MGFTNWADQNKVTPKPPNLTRWLRANPETAGEILAAAETYEHDDILRWLAEEHGLRVTDWETLRKRLSSWAGATRRG